MYTVLGCSVYVTGWAPNFDQTCRFLPHTCPPPQWQWDTACQVCPCSWLYRSFAGPAASPNLLLWLSWSTAVQVIGCSTTRSCVFDTWLQSSVCTALSGHLWSSPNASKVTQSPCFQVMMSYRSLWKQMLGINHTYHLLIMCCHRFSTGTCHFWGFQDFRAAHYTNPWVKRCFPCPGVIQ